MTKNLIETEKNLSLKDSVLALLEENKAEDVTVVDLAGKSDMADYMIVASGRSTRHVGAIADNLVKEFKKIGVGPVQSEGTDDCNWVLLDAFDVVVHIFRPEVREYYNLEKMWQTVLPENAEEMAEFV